MLTLPAAWRDLFRKSGRVLDAELSRAGLALAPAPPRRYGFADGSELFLPTGRGEQWVALTDAYGEPAAVAWRELLDNLDASWQALRRLGLEAEFNGSDQLTPAVRRVLQPRQNLAALAGRLPTQQLAQVVLEVADRLDQDPRRLPGWHAVRLSVERTFGRWQVTDTEGRPQPADILGTLLMERLSARGVEVRTGLAVTAILTGADGLRLETTAGQVAVAAAISTLRPAAHAELTGNRADRRPARRLQPAAVGPRWKSWRTLLDLPRLQTTMPGVLAASPWSAGGPDSWAQLLTGALAAYRVHAELTGEDMRPTNKGYRPGAQTRTVISTSTKRAEDSEPE